jgi:hypothetical protein
MQVPTAGIPGSSALFDEKWQYTQFMPSFCTCAGCGNEIGCSGERPSGEDAPLYADSVVASAATATRPGTAAHFLLLVI